MIADPARVQALCDRLLLPLTRADSPVAPPSTTETDDADVVTAARARLVACGWSVLAERHRITVMRPCVEIDLGAALACR